MKITKLGHCCLLLEINGTRFLTDPGNYTTAQNEVTNIDFVVISHEHTDHLHVESLMTVLSHNPKAKVICNQSVGKMLDKESIPYQVIDSNSNEKTNEFDTNGIIISGHGTKHAPIFRDYEQVENTGYLFTDNTSTEAGAESVNKNMFYPGDSFEVTTIPNVSIDILAFPVTAPWCTISNAMDYVLAVKPKIAFPVHDGNLVRHGLTNRLPGEFLPKNSIQFIALELGKETDF